MEKEENKDYSTRDLYLASALVSLGFEIENIDFQVEGERHMPVGYFSFVNTEELKEVEKKYWSGKLRIEPRMFINSMRGLKAQITGEYKSPHSNFNK